MVVSAAVLVGHATPPALPPPVTATVPEAANATCVPLAKYPMPGAKTVLPEIEDTVAVVFVCTAQGLVIELKLPMYATTVGALPVYM